MYAWSVAVSGSYAYVADSDGLYILDVSDPASPIEVVLLSIRRGLHGVLH